MTAYDPLRPNIDGVVPPDPAPLAGMVPRSVIESAKGTARTPVVSKSIVVYIVLAVLYVLPAFVFIALLPSPDISLARLTAIGNLVYGAGTVLWLSIATLGFLRLSGIKDRPRLQHIGLIRLAIATVPLLIVGPVVLLLINREPILNLDILEPKRSELVAPVSITFGADSALQVFSYQNLIPIKYEWDFNGDGTVDQETFDPRATYVFNRAGIYSIVSRVTMTDGQTKLVSRRLLISKASFGVEPESPIVDESASFTLSHLIQKKEDLAKAEWDFDGDGTVDLEAATLDAAFTYHRLGVVNPSVMLTFANQTQLSYTRTIEVVKPPVQPFAVSLDTEPAILLGPPPFGVIFTVNTRESIAKVIWTYGDQKAGEAEGMRVAHVYDDVGNFSVTAIVRSQSGSVARLSKIVRVTNPLVINDLRFEGTPPVQNFAVDGQVPLTLDLTPVTSQPLVSFSWDAQGASEVETSDKTLHAVYRKEGKYSLDLIGVDPDQNVLRRRITVSVRPPASVVAFSIDPPDPIAPALVEFDATDTFISPSEQITGFEWDFGDGQFNDQKRYSGSRIEHQYDVPGTYTIILNVRTTKGNTYTGRQSLVVRAPLIDACFVPSRRTGSAPLGVRFDAECSTGEFTSWLWDFGDNAQSDQKNPTHVFIQPGEYTVTLTATDKDGTKNVKKTTISVRP